MTRTTFNEYLEDMYGISSDMLSETERANAYKHYEDSFKITEFSNEAAAARKIAKMFGGKALKGTTAQKDWGERIRAGKLQKMSAQQATDLMSYTGIIDTAKFWIENRSVSADKFTAENIQKDIAEGNEIAVVRRMSQHERSEYLKTRYVRVFVITSPDGLSLKEGKVIEPVLNDTMTIHEKIQAKTKVKFFEVALCTLERCVTGCLTFAKHPAIEIESVVVEGVTARVFNIPSLSKNQVVYEYEGKVYRGYTK